MPLDDALRNVALGLLDTKLEELVALSMARLLREEPAYSKTAREDLKVQMRRTLELSLIRIAGVEVPTRLASAAYETGRLRALQEIELQAVLHAYRIDLRVLWDAIIDEGQRLGLDANPSFIRGLSQVLQAVEENSADVVQGYRQATDQMHRGLEEARAAAFDRLVSEGGQDEHLVLELSHILDLPANGRYMCLVGRFPHARPDALNASVARLTQRSVSTRFSWTAGELIGIVLLQKVSIDVAVSHLHELDEFPCGVFDVVGLGNVPLGLRLARAAVRGSQTPGIRHLRQNWVHASAFSDMEVGEALMSDVFSPIFSLVNHEREAVMETIEAFLAGDGTVADISQRTYRHRNTVRKRLQLLQDITGLNLSRPGDVTSLSLAFDVYRERNR